jgi:hypothetical protein
LGLSSERFFAGYLNCLSKNGPQFCFKNTKIYLPWKFQPNRWRSTINFAKKLPFSQIQHLKTWNFFANEDKQGPKTCELCVSAIKSLWNCLSWWKNAFWRLKNGSQEVLGLWSDPGFPKIWHLEMELTALKVHALHVSSNEPIFLIFYKYKLFYVFNRFKLRDVYFFTLRQSPCPRISPIPSDRSSQI